MLQSSKYRTDLLLMQVCDAVFPQLAAYQFASKAVPPLVHRGYGKWSVEVEPSVHRTTSASPIRFGSPLVLDDTLLGEMLAAWLKSVAQKRLE
jgi:hypothetical protein